MMDIAALVWYDATIIGKLSKVRESRKRENVAKPERMFYYVSIETNIGGQDHERKRVR